jgi:hypothetical protein
MLVEHYFPASWVHCTVGTKQTLNFFIIGSRFESPGANFPFIIIIFFFFFFFFFLPFLHSNGDLV